MLQPGISWLGDHNKDLGDTKPATILNPARSIFYKNKSQEDVDVNPGVLLWVL